MLDFMYVKYIVHYEWVLLLIYCGAEMHPCDPYIYIWQKVKQTIMAGHYGGGWNPK